MDSFFHEIPCPDDRAIRKFLWNDCFHDGVIECVAHDQPAAGDVTVQVHASAWPGDEVWASIPPGTRREQHAYYEEHLRPRLTYRLRFHRVRHFQHIMGSDYAYEEMLCARFRDTPLLRRLQAQCGKPLYHLRIHTTHGVMDIVFERFTIRRLYGRVDYRCDMDAGRSFWYEAMQSDVHSALRRLSGVREDEMDESDRIDWLMGRMFTYEQEGNVAGMLPLAREAITVRPGALWPADAYAARLLGFHGDSSDLPALVRRCFDPDIDGFAMLETKDAIERIREREAAHA